MNGSFDSVKKLNSIEWFIIAEDARITSPTFKVFIPKLTTGMGHNTEEEVVESVDSSCILNDTPIGAAPIHNSNCFVVKNMTSYRVEHVGHMEMESMEMESMSQSTTNGETELAGPGPHSHAIIKALSSKSISAKKITGKNIRIYDLNRPIVKKGTKVLGVCVNNNIHDMGVIHIPGAIKFDANPSSESLGADSIGG